MARRRTNRPSKRSLKKAGKKPARPSRSLQPSRAMTTHASPVEQSSVSYAYQPMSDQAFSPVQARQRSKYEMTRDFLRMFNISVPQAVAVVGGSVLVMFIVTKIFSTPTTPSA